MGTGFSKKKKQAKLFQQQIDRMSSQLEAVEAKGSAAGGLVSITLDGNHKLKHISIKPECVDPEDVEGLEDLIRLAYEEALEKLEEESKKSLPNLPDFKGLI